MRLHTPRMSSRTVLLLGCRFIYVILSDQARLLCNETTEVVVATTNVGHLSRFTAALDWQSID
jgi:hypothetical protein